MSATSSLENSLAGLFKAAPKLPENAKKTLVAWLPWLNLIGGLFALSSAYWLYHWAHLANSLVNYTNSLSEAFGGPKVSSSRWSVGLYIALAVLAVEAVMYIAAFPGLKAHKKAGWNFLFYALLLNTVYGIVTMFTDYGGGSNLIGLVIGTVVGLYFLFQVRDVYSGGSSRTPSNPPTNTPS